MLTKRKFTN